jgi:hypothetical protein
MARRPQPPRNSLVRSRDGGLARLTKGASLFLVEGEEFFGCQGAVCGLFDALENVCSDAIVGGHESEEMGRADPDQLLKVGFPEWNAKRPLFRNVSVNRVLGCGGRFRHATDLSHLMGNRQGFDNPSGGMVRPCHPVRQMENVEGAGEGSLFAGMAQAQGTFP